MNSRDIFLEVWKNTDAYIKFMLENQYEDFSSRLKEWRILSGKSKIEMARAIYYERYLMGLENDDTSSIEIPEDLMIEDSPLKPLGYEVDLKRQLKAEKRITSLMRSYSKMEDSSSGYNNNTAAFSINTLKILKKLMHCDYDFLLCDIKTPHKYSEELSKTTGLNIKSIEKLFTLSSSFYNSDSDKTINVLAKSILQALNALINDYELMKYISYYITVPYELPDDSLYVNQPVSGLDDDDAVLDGEEYHLNKENLKQVYRYTLANLLINLRYKTNDNVFKSELPKNIYIQKSIASDNDAIGTRLKKMRLNKIDSNGKPTSQPTIAKWIIDYRIEHGIIAKPQNSNDYDLLVQSALRTYQNWESKTDTTTDTRLILQDIRMLKDIFDCDYDYLFGESNYIKYKPDSISFYLGLSHSNLELLKSYTTFNEWEETSASIPDYHHNCIEALDLIINDESFLEYLTYLVTDITYYTNADHCHILKPIPDTKANIEYSNTLFPEDSCLRNIFLIKLFDRLEHLRQKNIADLAPSINI